MDGGHQSCLVGKALKILLEKSTGVGVEGGVRVGVDEET